MRSFRSTRRKSLWHTKEADLISEEEPADAEEEKYIIVGTVESDPLNNKISNESPIGKALMGSHVGDRVEAFTPGGIIWFRVLSIETE